MVKLKNRQQFSLLTPKNSLMPGDRSCPTFGYLKNMRIKVQGLALGASSANALIISREGYRNEPRFPDELFATRYLI